MNLLVTGGAGFIGSNFIRYILNRHSDWNIVCLDLLTYAGSIENLDCVVDDFRFTFIKGDIADYDQVSDILEKHKIDIVVNFAAQSHVDRSIDNPGIFVQTNVLGTQVLLDACLKHNVKRFHQVSTDEVYGDLPIDRPDLLFDENSPLAPSSPYSSSKAAADLIVLSYHRTYGLDVTISRCSNNYGICQHKEKLIPCVISNALSDNPVPVFGSGLNVRDWIYVMDHCSGIETVIESGKAGEVYNIGSNNEVSNITLIKYLLNRLNKPYSLIKYVEDSKGHDRRYGLDCSKIKRELGWLPKADFYKTVDETIDWYAKNKYLSDM